MVISTYCFNRYCPATFQPGSCFVFGHSWKCEVISERTLRWFYLSKRQKYFQATKEAFYIQIFIETNWKFTIEKLTHFIRIYILMVGNQLLIPMKIISESCSPNFPFKTWQTWGLNYPCKANKMKIIIIINIITWFRYHASPREFTYNK